MSVKTITALKTVVVFFDMTNFDIKKNNITKYRDILRLIKFFLIYSKFFLIFCINYFGTVVLELRKSISPNFFWKGGEIFMNFSQGLKNVFIAFCIKVLKNEARNCYKELERRKKVISIHELTMDQLSYLNKIEEYEIEFYQFEVMGYKIIVKDDILAKAIQQLPPKKKDIILLSFFLDMSDTEIAKKMNVVQSTISRHRVTTLKKLKNIIMEEYKSEKKTKEKS